MVGLHILCAKSPIQLLFKIRNFRFERDEAERAVPIEPYPWDGVENLRLLTQLQSSVVVGVY